MSDLFHPNRQLHNRLIYDRFHQLLGEHAEKFRGTVVDLGCGDAPYRDWVLERAEKYIGVDWGESPHEIQAEVVANLNEPLPLESDSADTVFSVSVLEHLSQPRIMLAEAHRILRPGGHLILQVPWQWWIHEAPYDYFRYSKFGLEHLLAEAGFVDVNVQAQAGFFSSMALKSNYFSLRFIRGPSPVKAPVRGLLSVGWTVGQTAAPLLDRLDRDWNLETTGYFVTARRGEDPS